MAKKNQNQFELLDSLIERNRRSRWIYFWFHHSVVFIFFCWILSFLLKYPLLVIFGSDGLGNVLRTIVLIDLALMGTILLFLYNFKWIIAIVDQNQVRLANNIFGNIAVFSRLHRFILRILFLREMDLAEQTKRRRNLIPFGVGFHPKFPWEIMSDDENLIVSLNEFEETTPEDKPKTSPTLERYPLLFRIGFNYNADIQRVISFLQIGRDVATATVTRIVEAIVRGTFPYLTSDEARRSIGAITQLCTLVLETRDSKIFELQVADVVLNKIQFDTIGNGNRKQVIAHSQLNIIEAVIDYAREQFRDMEIEEDNSCSIVEYLGIQVQFLNIFDVDYSKEVQEQLNKAAALDTLHRGICKLLGVNPDADPEKITLKLNEIRNDPEQQVAYLEISRMAMAATGSGEYKTTANTSTDNINIGGVNEKTLSRILDLFEGRRSKVVVSTTT